MTDATTEAQPAVPRRTIREDAINLPNLLTMLRIVMIPLVLWLLVDGTPRASFWAAMVYVLTAVTDALDGWLARRQGLVSVLGKFLDPLADKLLVMAVLVFMVWMGRFSWIGTVAVILIIGRELSITALRTISMSEGVVIASGQGGKEKTALQMVAILLLILHHPYDIHFGFFEVHANLHEAGLVLLYVSLVLALTSAGEYLKLFVEAVEAKERRLAEGDDDG
ncbi:MAG: CDP-diacylglycerol--glycerol-3-phosphate 3-phosphatidyltransferase [Myxococcota bacterium]